jgi:CRISPR-associated protein Cmr4
MEMLLYLYAESPVHAGAADSLGVLDLPVQREASTGYPVIWGQSLKGALRRAAEQHDAWDVDHVTAVFGSAVREPDEDRGDGHETIPGNLRVGDAQLIAMPVPTLRRTFAWVTSEIALGRLARKYRALRADPAVVPQPPTVLAGRGLSSNVDWVNRRGEVLGPCVVPFDAETDDRLAHWARRLAHDAIGADEVFAPFTAKLRSDLLLVDSEVMPVLLRECTEQAVRVQLDENKTVAQGPFYSEYLPAETILVASLSLREHGRDDAALDDWQRLRTLFDGDALLQVGGDETLGKGLVWARFLDEITALPEPQGAQDPVTTPDLRS